MYVIIKMTQTVIVPIMNFTEGANFRIQLTLECRWLSAGLGIWHFDDNEGFQDGIRWN